MKKLLIFLFFTYIFSFFTPCFGQFNIYHPFPDSGAAWREATWYVYFCGSSSTDVFQDFDYYVRGDTIVNGKTYFKVNSSGGYEHNNGGCGDPLDTIWNCFNSLVCLIRNDTSGKKVYGLFPPDYSYDTLLYDFTLNLGDTLPDTYVSLRINKFYVLSIDSVLVGPTYRKQFIIAYDTGFNRQIFDSIIEGIGSAEGLLEPIVPVFEGGSWLDCFVDSTTDFSYPLENTCTMFYKCPVSLGATVIEKPVEAVSVFPNPNNGKFTLQIDNSQLKMNNENTQIQIYNELGEQVYSKLSIVNCQLSIDLSSQPNGIYLYRVMAETGELIGEGKVIIQK